MWRIIIVPDNFFEPYDEPTLTKQRTIKKPHHETGEAFLLYGAPEGIRTPDRSVRSRVLYPAELQAHILRGTHYLALC